MNPAQALPKVDSSGEDVKITGSTPERLGNIMQIFHPSGRDAEAYRIGRAITRYNESVPPDRQWWLTPMAPTNSAGCKLGMGTGSQSLTPEEYHEYQQFAGRMAKGYLAGFIRDDPGWIPDEQTIEQMKRWYGKAHEDARELLFRGQLANLKYENNQQSTTKIQLEKSHQLIRRKLSGQ